MVLFPHAKINLGLQVTEKRDDGFHNIVSCLYPIGWSDMLEVIESGELAFTSSGLEIPGASDDNLCIKAYQIMRAQFEIPPVRIHLHKVIPIGAGLGGGSSDAAFTLKALRSLFDLPVSDSDLEKLASQIGSDCPFFINSEPVIVTGKGDILNASRVMISKKYLVVVTPPIQVNTGNAYAMVSPRPPVTDLEQALTKDLTNWQALVNNDFEKSVFQQYPDIANIKETLLDQGAVFSSLSGSGSSVFGIFHEEKPAQEWFGSNYTLYTQELI